MKFTKYTATGNDFILIDGRDHLTLEKKQIVKLCDRHFGIGADGVIFLRNSIRADFKMEIYNADGSYAEMCGNGARAICQFSKRLLNLADTFSFESNDLVYPVVCTKELIKIKMVACTKPIKINEDFSAQFANCYFINTGVPHCVVEVKDQSNQDFKLLGKEIRNHESFKDGANVNFCSFENNILTVKTFERGVEDFTYSCGTGVTASAIVFSLIYQLKDKVTVKTRGGVLTVYFNSDYSEVYLEGPSLQVFDGEIKI